MNEKSHREAEDVELLMNTLARSGSFSTMRPTTSIPSDMVQYSRA